MFIGRLNLCVVEAYTIDSVARFIKLLFFMANISQTMLTMAECVRSGKFFS